jgi:peptide methionine sulfoxide reductase MsrB
MAKFILYFKDPSRSPLRFYQRVYDSRCGWYVYPDRWTPPVVVRDSDIDRVEAI